MPSLNGFTDDVMIHRTKFVRQRCEFREGIGVVYRKRPIHKRENSLKSRKCHDTGSVFILTLVVTFSGS